MRAARSGILFTNGISLLWSLTYLMVHSSKQSFLGGLCSERNTFSRAAGVRCARSGIFFHGKLRMCKLCREPKYLANSLKNVVAVRKKVHTRTRFRAPRACGAREAGFFFHGSNFFAKMVPTRYHTPLGGFAKWVSFQTQAGIQTGWTDITKIYV